MYDSRDPNFKFNEPSLTVGRFTGNGTGALATVASTSKGLSVTRTGVGALTITFTDPPVGIVQSFAAWVCSAGADKNVRITPIAAGALGTPYQVTTQVTYQANGSAVDLTSSEELNVECWHARTSQP